MGQEEKVGIALSEGAARKYEDLADIVIEPEVGDFGFFDLTHGSEIIKRGKEATFKIIIDNNRYYSF